MRQLNNRLWWALLLAALTGCAAPSASHGVTYDFGPGSQMSAAPGVPAALLTAVVLGEVETTQALDGSALLYRLAYYDAQQLKPYAQARWSMPPAQLLRQRLREQLAQQRPVLLPSDGGAAKVAVLRVELEEFSQVFSTPQACQALVRAHVTLSEAGPRNGTAAQTTLVQQQACQSPDARGGAQALAAASDALIAQIAAWLPHGSAAQ